MEIDNDGSDREHSSSKKRRHPDSVTAPKVKSASEILQLVEHPNFEELSRWNPVFARAWEATRQQQRETQKTFSACVSQEFTMALTRALLKTYLDLQLPYLETNHLCPPVPNRFFYLHWIHSELLPQLGPRNPLFGMDVGSGATAIYSLLAAKFFNCHMFTTEIDPAAASMALQNVQANQLEARIHVTVVAPSQSQHCVQLHQHHHQAPGGPLERSLAAMEQFLHQQQQVPSHAPLDFVMTNPPFYDPNSMELITNPRMGDGRARNDCRQSTKRTTTIRQVVFLHAWEENVLVAFTKTIDTRLGPSTCPSDGIWAGSIYKMVPSVDIGTT
jgi:23S rRNA A1618 N6-methylase RlmF